MKKRTQSSSKGVSYVSRNFVKLCLLWIFSLSSLMIQAQDNQRISVDLRGESLESTLWYLQNRTKFIFMYATEDIANITDISVRAKNKTITEILDECLEGTNLTYEVSGTAIVIKKRKTNKITISGWIRDASGEALPGATVTVRGSKDGAIAGLDGHYTFNIPAQEGLILTYSFIGMEKKTVRYTGKKTINVTLNSSSTEIDEVVVTGYQNIQRRDLVGSITTVKAKDILMPSYTTIDQMLQGRVAGMIVTNTSSRVGTAPKIQIRGTSTLLGNQDPLWVVDGIIQEDPLELNASSLMTEDLKNIIGNQISWLNPADIESISILKDASATAIYGSKASNGVIEITTKKNTTDRLSVNYTSNFVMGTRPNYGQFNYMNSKERVLFSQEAFNWGTPYGTEPIKQIYTYEGLLNMYLSHDISSEDFLAYLEENLTEAIPFLPETQDTWGCLTKGAASMILLRVHLMQKDFVKAKAVAKSVYEMGKEGGGSTYELMKDYSKIFSIDNQRNSELILAIPCDGTKDYSPNQWYCAAMPGDYPHISTAAKGSNSHRMRWAFYDTYEKGDKRLNTIVAEYVNNKGKKVKRGDKNLENGALPFKYDQDPTTQGNFAKNDIPVFRYAEAILGYAEAINETEGVTDLANKKQGRFV